jgi:hypothetical protein
MAKNLSVESFNAGKDIEAMKHLTLHRIASLLLHFIASSLHRFITSSLNRFCCPALLVTIWCGTLAVCFQVFKYYSALKIEEKFRSIVLKTSDQPIRKSFHELISSDSPFKRILHPTCRP